MNVQIHSIRFDADQKLLEFITNKVNKLTQFSDEIISSEVFLRLSKSSERENKLVEIKLIIPGGDLFAKNQTKTFEEGTDLCIDALRKQLSKRKEKIRSH